MKRLLFLLLIPTLGWGQIQLPCLVILSGSKGFKALPASSVDSTSFTANWKTFPGGASYKLDVATDLAFTSYVSGYQNKSVSGTSQSVTTLTSNTLYYYRGRVTRGSTTYQSNTISVTTLSGPKFFLTADVKKFKTADTKYYTLP
jgi:hypothetical protein